MIRNYNHHSLDKGNDPILYYYTANSPAGYVSLKLDLAGTAKPVVAAAIRLVEEA